MALRALLFGLLCGWAGLLWADDPAAQRLALSAAAHAWVAEHPRLRVGLYRSGWPPFDIVGPAGEYRGLSADYLRALATDLGLQVEPVLFDDWAAAQRALRQKEVDVLPSVARTPERER